MRNLQLSFYGKYFENIYIFFIVPSVLHRIMEMGAFLNLVNLIPQSCGFSMVKFHGF